MLPQLYGASKICAVVDEVILVIDIDTEYAAYPLNGDPPIRGVVRADGGIVGLLSVEQLFSCERNS